MDAPHDHGLLSGKIWAPREMLGKLLLLPAQACFEINLNLLRENLISRVKFSTLICNVNKVFLVIKLEHEKFYVSRIGFFTCDEKKL